MESAFCFILFVIERKTKMKTTIKSTLALILALLMTLCLFSCKNNEAETPQTSDVAAESGASEATGHWANAKYLEDTTLGEGAKTVTVKVIVEDKTVVFTIKTDAETLGDALLAHGLIEGEESSYGLYVKVVNGILADYDVDQSYWGFSKGGEYMMTGVDGTEFADGETYELTYTK